MADDPEVQVGERLRRELLAVEVADPTWDRVVADATATRPDRRGLLMVAASVVAVLVFLGVVVRPTSPTVVLQDSGETTGWPRPATIEDLLGRVFESTGALPGAPAPSGSLTLSFLPPTPAGGEPAGGDAVLAVTTDPGCNGGTVAIELTSGGSLATDSSILSARRGCPGLPQEMDAWATALITSQPALQLLAPDRLRVQTADGVVDLDGRPLVTPPSTTPSPSTPVPPPEARIPARPTLTVPPAAEATGEGGADLAATVLPGWEIAEPTGAMVEVMALRGALALPPGAVSLRRYDVGRWVDVPIEPFGVNALAGLGTGRPFPIGIRPATEDGVLEPGWYEVRIDLVEGRGASGAQPVVMTIGTAVLVPPADADLSGIAAIPGEGSAAEYADAVLEVEVGDDVLLVRNTGTAPILSPTYEVIAYRDRYWIPRGPPCR